MSHNVSYVSPQPTHTLSLNLEITLVLSSCPVLHVFLQSIGNCMKYQIHVQLLIKKQWGTKSEDGSAHKTCIYFGNKQTLQNV